MSKAPPRKKKKPMDRAQLKALAKVRALISEIAGRDSNEAETSDRVKTVFTEILGYDRFRHITHEHAVRNPGSTDHVDLAVTLEEGKHAKPVILVEVNRVNYDLSHKHIKQASTYAIQTGCNWVVLTNARHWMLYHIEFLQPPEPKLIEQWSLLDGDPAAVLKKFRLISYKSTRDSRSTIFVEMGERDWLPPVL